MRTDTEMMNLILQIADTLEVEAIALSGSRTNPRAPKDEFQDYDVVYIVDDLEDLISDLSWLDQYGNRLIEQYNRLGHRRLYLMLFEDGNRIDLTLCPKESIQEWVDSEANFEVIKDDKGLFEAYQPNSKRYWTAPPTEEEFAASCNEFWWVSAYIVKAIRRNQLIYATDHLYGSCQQELLFQLSKRRSSQFCLIYPVSIKSLSLYLLPWGYSIEKLKFWPKRWGLLTIRK